MQKKKKMTDRLSGLTWDDLGMRAGHRIVGRGRSYWNQGRVSDLAITTDGTLIATVRGSNIYVTRVDMNRKGLPESLCTCPYEYNCKHGVAVVLKYLEKVLKDIPYPKAKKDNKRFSLLANENRGEQDEDEEGGASVNVQKEMKSFLKDKTKPQLIELINELAKQHPGNGTPSCRPQATHLRQYQGAGVTPKTGDQGRSAMKRGGETTGGERVIHRTIPAFAPNWRLCSSPDMPMRSSVWEGSCCKAAPVRWKKATTKEKPRWRWLPASRWSSRRLTSPLCPRQTS